MAAFLFRRSAVLMASLTLLSCLGGGGDGTDGGGTGFSQCESITGGNSRVTTSVASGCFGCSVTDAEKAADGDLFSAASIDVPNSFAGQGASVRATSQPGIVFPAGQQAGVYYQGPASSGFSSSDLAVTISTYLGGELQETPTSYELHGPDETGSENISLKSFSTSKAFDAVEVMISNTQAATGPFSIYEICSNSSVQ
jgi:hypothetical protein